MLTIWGNRTTGACDGLPRRDFLKAGVLGLTGLSLADVLRGRSQATSAGAPSNPKSVILYWLDGGPSHLETYDPKPEAPAEFRGPFGSIPTNVPGIRVNELLVEHTRIMDKMSVLRSVHHDTGDHFAAAHSHARDSDTGVLIFVALVERQVQVLADTAIHAKAGDAVWQAAAKAVQDGMRQPDPTAGIERAIALFLAELCQSCESLEADLGRRVHNVGRCIVDPFHTGGRLIREMCAGELLDIVGGQFVDPANVDFFKQSVLGEGVDQVFLCCRILLRDNCIFNQQSRHHRSE